MDRHTTDTQMAGYRAAGGAPKTCLQILTETAHWKGQTLFYFIHLFF